MIRYRLFDSEMLDEMAHGDRAKKQQLLRTLLQSLEQTLANAKTALEEQSEEGLTESIHRFKGTFGMAGGHELSNRCQHLMQLVNQSSGWQEYSGPCAEFVNDVESGVAELASLSGPRDQHGK